MPAGSGVGGAPSGDVADREEAANGGAAGKHGATPARGAAGRPTGASVAGPASDATATGPAEGLEAFLAAAATRDETAARARLTERSLALLDRFQALARELQASTIPHHLLAVWLESFDRQRPEVRGVTVDGDAARLDVRYASGHPAVLRLAREDGRWKLDLSEDLASSLALLEAAEGRVEAARRGDWDELVDDDD